MPFGYYLDTNIYLYWAAGRKLSVLRRLRRERRPIFLSPVVVIEAIEDYWFAPTEQLSTYRRALRLMLEHGGQRILPPEQAFTFDHLRLGRQQKLNPNMQPRHLRRWLQFAARLPRQWRGRAHDGRHRFDRTSFKKQVDSYRDSYTDNLVAVRDQVFQTAGIPPGGRFDETARSEIRQFLKTADWTVTYFKRTAALFPPAMRDSVIRRLEGAQSAAFELDTKILDLLLFVGYEPKAHRGDVFDHSLLTYLADDGLTFLTGDRRLRDKILPFPSTRSNQNGLSGLSSCVRLEGPDFQRPRYHLFRRRRTHRAPRIDVCSSQSRKQFPLFIDQMERIAGGMGYIKMETQRHSKAEAKTGQMPTFRGAPGVPRKIYLEVARARISPKPRATRMAADVCRFHRLKNCARRQNPVGIPVAVARMPMVR